MYVYITPFKVGLLIKNQSRLIKHIFLNIKFKQGFQWHFLKFYFVLLTHRLYWKCWLLFLLDSFYCTYTILFWVGYNILNCSDCQISCNGWSVMISVTFQYIFKTFFFFFLLSDDIISSQHSECVYFSPYCCSRLGQSWYTFQGLSLIVVTYYIVHFWPACVSLCDAAQYLRTSRAILLALSCMSFLISLLHVDFRWAACVCSHP